MFPNAHAAHFATDARYGPKEHGAGTPHELAAETAALRSAGVLACEFWQRPAASLVAVSEMRLHCTIANCRRAKYALSAERGARTFLSGASVLFRIASKSTRNDHAGAAADRNVRQELSALRKRGTELEFYVQPKNSFTVFCLERQ